MVEKNTQSLWPKFRFSLIAPECTSTRLQITQNLVEIFYILYNFEVKIDLKICQKWAELLTIDSTNAIDSLLLAQAITNNMVLVTRNIKHFKMFGAKCLNPFGEENV